MGEKLWLNQRELLVIILKSREAKKGNEAKSNDGERGADPTSPIPILRPILHGDPYNHGSREGKGI